MHLLSSLTVLLASCAFAASAPVDCDIFGANCAGGGTGIADLFAQPGYDDSIDVAVNEISTNGLSSESTVSPVVGNSDVSGLVSNDPIFNNVAENSDKADDKQTSKKASFNRGYLTKFCDDTTAVSFSQFLFQFTRVIWLISLSGAFPTFNALLASNPTCRTRFTCATIPTITTSASNRVWLRVAPAGG